MDRHTVEKGQVLVLIILAIVAIFGFAALAVDGGRYFSERRRAQNAADAAAYAAAYAGAKGQDWKAAGITSTTTNGYNDTDPNQNSTAVTDVRIHHAPVRGRYSSASETIHPNEYYQVIIRTRVDKIFSQLVYNGELWVEVEAVARSTPQKGFPSGSAVVATCPDCCDALEFSGTGDINVVGGNVVSNSSGGAHSCYSAERNGTAVVDISGGSFITGGTLYNNTSKSCKDADGHVVSPCISADSFVQAQNPQTYSYPYVPSCSGLPTVSNAKYTSSATISPGIYTSGIDVAGGKNTLLRLNAGMYCLEGDFNITSGSVYGENVMIYMKSGSISINTTYEVHLTAPTTTSHCIADSAIAPDCWSGFLIYMPSNNDGTVSLAGGGSTNYSGTIYAVGPPHSSGSAKCSFAGSQVDTELNASIICYTVKITGTNTFTVNYDSSLNAQQAGSIELAQ